MDDQNPDGDAPKIGGASEQTDYRAVATDGARPAGSTRSTRAAASRRRVLGVLGAGGVAALAGCSGDGQDDGTDDGTADGTDGSDLQESVTVSLGYEPSAASDFWRNIYGILPYFTNVIEPLTWASPEIRPDPWLATDWERTGDRTWEFQLREGVTFHNGDEMTAEAVRFSMAEMFDQWGNAGPFLRLESGDSVEVIDDYRVEFTTVEPIGNYHAHIAHNMVAVQHPDADTVEEKPIGTGPFEVTDFESGQHVTVEAFDDYWGDEEPAVEQITFRVIPDASTRALSLESHEIDVAHDPPRAQLASLRQAPETNVQTQMQPRVAHIAINNYLPPTDDVRLRRALNHAVDQAELVETVLEGVGEPAKGMISPMVYWSAHDEVREYETDREEASRLVEDSDYDGETLQILLTQGTTEGSTKAEVLQDWFDRIGVDTDIRVLENQARWQAWSGGEAHLSLTEGGTFSAAADYILFQLYHRDGSHNKTMHEAEGTGTLWLGEEEDTLIEEGQETLDEDLKAERYREIQRRVMDRAVNVPLYYVEYVIGTYEDVKDINMPPIQQKVRWASLKHHDS